MDNRNILDGVEHTAYTDGKIAAIEELNAEESLEDVQEAAESAVNEYHSTILKNLYKSWNESVLELESIVQSSQEFSSGEWDLYDDLLKMRKYQSNVSWDGYYFIIDVEAQPTSISLPNGEDFEVQEIWAEYLNSEGNTKDDDWSPLQTDFNHSQQPDEGTAVQVRKPDSDETIIYLSGETWMGIREDVNDTFDSVQGGLQDWTANVYNEVQSGSIDVADLLTPREQAELLSDDEDYPQAVADLIALHISVDPEREATISFDDRDITITGLMAPTSPPENGFQTGQSYDPASEEWDLYFTYDPTLGSGGWDEVEPTISEGELVFTAEPYEGTIYRVPTNQGTVEVVTDEFDADGDTWVADVSGQLDRTSETWSDFETGVDGGTVTFGSLPDEPTDFEISTVQGDAEIVPASSFTEVNGSYEADTGLGIAEITGVTAEIDRAYVDEDDSTSVYAEEGEGGYETVQISDPFTIESIENSDGEEVGETEFSQTEPQDDENYITQEEWDELQEQNEELIERYEDALDDDSLLGGGWDPFDDGIPDVPGGAAAAAGVAVVVIGFGVLRQIASLYLPGR